jgi:hypothetical protein
MKRALWNALQLAVFAVLAAGLIYFSLLVRRAHGEFSFSASPQGDFGNLWRAGLLARGGHLANLYAPPLFQTWNPAQPGTPPGDWLYPPEILPLGALVSLLPFPAGFLVWDAGSVGLILLLLRRAGLPWAVGVLTIFSPAEYRCLAYGQVGGLLAGLAFCGVLLAAARPALAGLMIGVLTIKPPAGALVLAAWVARGNWRAILAAGGCAALLALVPLVWLGPDCWVWFVQKSLPMAREYVRAPFPQTYQLGGVSVFWMVRGLGGGVVAAGAAQAAAGLAACAAVYRAWRRLANRFALAALTVILMLFLTPYAFTADMVGFELALAVLAWQRGWKFFLLDGVLWLWPGYSPVVTAVAGFSPTPIIVAIAAIMAWRQARA